MDPFQKLRSNTGARIDARGLRCPLPLIRLQQRVEAMVVGEVVELIADDAGVEDDLPAWSETTGHRILQLAQDSRGDWVAYIEKCAPVPAPDRETHT